MTAPLLHRMKYSVKLLLSGYFYGAVAYWALLAVMLANVESWSIGKADLHTLSAVLVIGFPLFNIVLFAGLFAEETEERTLRLHYTYRHRPVWLLLEKIALASLILLLAYTVCLIVAHVLLLPLTAQELWEVTRHVLPANVYLASLSLLFSLVGRGVLAGIGAGVGYWMLELTTLGKWTGPLFLFERVFPTGSANLSDNGLYLTLAGMGCFGLCVLVIGFGQRKIAI